MCVCLCLCVCEREIVVHNNVGVLTLVTCHYISPFSIVSSLTLLWLWLPPVIGGPNTTGNGLFVIVIVVVVVVADGSVKFGVPDMCFSAILTVFFPEDNGIEALSFGRRPVLSSIEYELLSRSRG